MSCQGDATESSSAWKALSDLCREIWLSRFRDIFDRPVLFCMIVVTRRRDWSAAAPCVHSMTLSVISMGFFFFFNPFGFRSVSVSHDLCEMRRRVLASADAVCSVALSPSRRLLENSAILDLYERTSLKSEKAGRRFTPAWGWRWCWCCRGALAWGGRLVRPILRALRRWKTRTPALQRLGSLENQSVHQPSSF